MVKFKLSKELIQSAKDIIPKTKVNRTIASKNDTLVGNIGELAFAQYLLGDFRASNLGSNKGKEDLFGIEIKCSIRPYRENLNLLVREDYALRRSPEVYVQLLIDQDADKEINENSSVVVCGWTKHSNVMQSTPKDFGCSFKKDSGYRCFSVPFSQLNSMEGFKEKYIKRLLVEINK